MKKISVSFCIITNGRRLIKIHWLLSSIKKLDIDEYEIIIVGYLKGPKRGARYIEARDLADSGKLGAMRNKACEAASKDLFVVLDDDIIFPKNFYQNLQSVDFDYDILLTRMLNMDHSRYWDWAISNDREHVLISYEERHKDIYITGGRCILKAETFGSVNWNSELGFYESEDVDFSDRLKRSGYSIQLSKELFLFHNDWRYTQAGRKVKKTLRVKVLLSRLKYECWKLVPFLKRHVSK